MHQHSEQADGRSGRGRTRRVQMCGGERDAPGRSSWRRSPSATPPGRKTASKVIVGDKKDSGSTAEQRSALHTSRPCSQPAPPPAAVAAATPGPLQWAIVQPTTALKKTRNTLLVRKNSRFELSNPPEFKNVIADRGPSYSLQPDPDSTPAPPIPDTPQPSSAQDDPVANRC